MPEAIAKAPRKLMTFDDRQPAAAAPPDPGAIATDLDPGKPADPPPPHQSVVAIHIKDGLFRKFIVGLLCYFAYSAIYSVVFNFKFLKQLVYWACAMLLSFVGWDVKPPKEVVEQGQAFYQRVIRHLPIPIRPGEPDPSVGHERDRQVAEAKELKERLAADAKVRADRVAAEVEQGVARAREEAEARIEQAHHAAERVATRPAASSPSPASSPGSPTA